MGWCPPRHVAIVCTDPILLDLLKRIARLRHQLGEHQPVVLEQLIHGQRRRGKGLDLKPGETLARVLVLLSGRRDGLREVPTALEVHHVEQADLGTPLGDDAAQSAGIRGA